jgi:hypothetical protein
MPVATVEYRIINTHQITILFAPFARCIKTSLHGSGLLILCAALSAAPLSARQPSTEPASEKPQPDPALERVWDLLSADRASKIDHAALAETRNTSAPDIRVDLASQLLHLQANGREILVCPIASGSITSRTPKGSFSVSATFENELIPYRGVFLGTSGEVLVSDVDRRQDPMPAGASFEPRPVAVMIQLSEAGPTIQSGLATRTATTSGDIRIPTDAAKILLELITPGTTVSIQ